MALATRSAESLLRLPMPVADQPAQVAALDVIVLQIRRLAIEVGILQRDDPAMQAQLLGLEHDAIDHLGLVPQHRAEPGDRCRTSAPPDRAIGGGRAGPSRPRRSRRCRAARPAPRGRPASGRSPGLESGKLVGDERDQVFRTAHDEGRPDRPAGGIGRSTLGLANPARDLLQEGRQFPAHRFRLARGQLRGHVLGRTLDILVIRPDQRPPAPPAVPPGSSSSLPRRRLAISTASPTRPTPARFKAALPIATIKLTGIRMDATQSDGITR